MPEAEDAGANARRELAAGAGSDPHLPWGVSPDGYRLPASTALGCVRLQVADLDRSVAWYEGVLGFRAFVEGSGMARLTARGQSEPLVELYEKPGASPVPPRGRLGLFHFAILLPDRSALGRFASHLQDERGRAEGTVGASDHLVSEALYLHDPDGLGVEVYADRPRSSWRHRDGQVVMATEPLDLHDLMEAGGRATWEGMPAGTTVGHMHLHVGDLARAEAFYHQGLGLDRVVWSYPGALFLSAGGYHHHLGINTWARGASPPGDDDARLLEWELVVPSAEEVEAVVRSVQGATRSPEAADRNSVAVDRGSDATDRSFEALDPSSGAVRPEPAGVLLRDPWGTALRVRTP